MAIFATVRYRRQSQRGAADLRVEQAQSEHEVIDAMMAVRHERRVFSPGLRAVIAASSSMLLLACGDIIIEAFYGKGIYEVQEIEDWLNNSVGSFLSVIGLVYGLVVAQYLGSELDKFFINLLFCFLPEGLNCPPF